MYLSTKVERVSCNVELESQTLDYHRLISRRVTDSAGLNPTEQNGHNQIITDALMGRTKIIKKTHFTSDCLKALTLNISVHGIFGNNFVLCILFISYRRGRKEENEYFWSPSRIRVRNIVNSVYWYDCSVKLVAVVNVPLCNTVPMVSPPRY